jgi:predicted glycosyltransferase
MLKIKNITFMDFEGQIANHLAFRLSDLVVVPKFFKKHYLKLYGAKNVRFYSGLKEEVYLWDFNDDKDYILELGIKRDLPVCVMRPPATSSLYYKKNDLFFEVLNYISKECKVILILRNKEQINELKLNKIINENIIIPNEVLNGPRLLYWADFTISAGGTMNRESALLGTPTYSIFKGLKSGVDEYLESLGILKFIKSPKEIKIEKKNIYKKLINKPNVLNEILDIIEQNLKLAS